MYIPTTLQVSTGLASATAIVKQKDFERWQQRTKNCTKFLWRAYLIGAMFGAIATGAVAFSQPQESNHEMPIYAALIMVIFMGLIFWGPLVWFALVLLYWSGSSSFKETMEILKTQGRVCGVCAAVSFYEGEKKIFPKVTEDLSLSPKMFADSNEDNNPILCEECHAALLAEIGQG